MNRKANIAVSGTLVGCMLVEASAGLTHGKALSEVHLITSAPLVFASSGAAMDYVQHNAVYDVVHAASLPRESELRLGGLTCVMS